MAIDHILEKLMNETDSELQSGKRFLQIGRTEMIEQYTKDPIEKKICKRFITKYWVLKKDYIKEKSYLTSTEEPKINYKEVGTNTLFGGWVGYMAHDIKTAMIGAIIAGGTTYYGQKTGANIKLSNLFWCTLVGQIIGGFFDPQNSDKYSIIGGSIGCGAAIINELRKGRFSRLTPGEKLRKLQTLETQYTQDVHQLVQTTVIKYHNKII